MNYREEIKKLTRTIPKSVIDGGVMQAGLWKERASKALKVASNPKAGTIELRRAFEEMQRFK